MPFISSNRPGSDELLQVEPLVWMLHAILKPRDEEYAWGASLLGSERRLALPKDPRRVLKVQLDIYLMLPTLGRGLNYTHHHVHDFPSTPHLPSIQLSLLELRTPGHFILLNHISSTNPTTLVTPKQLPIQRRS
ncbi:hypothetical protein TGAM01_v205160 [Trichoderma gamsii]|uniref:Uncharacterized protein n=1 Tax=Trichoderma gamsii TaxID=398673 RepID=A0A2P4ZN65_9HYPO|nr:hypothetical protein TGAM01_v205160 [Trichoderma gamsii]PON25723.1 hypothetical protein TGAM01_v205160 [Trichoderma gamsii]